MLPRVDVDVQFILLPHQVVRLIVDLTTGLQQCRESKLVKGDGLLVVRELVCLIDAISNLGGEIEK